MGIGSIGFPQLIILVILVTPIIIATVIIRASRAKNDSTTPGQSLSAQRFCAQCGTAVETNTRFCSNCGAAVGNGISQTENAAELVGPRTEYMGFWIRLAALFLDYILLGIVNGIVSGVTGITALGFLISALYFVLFTGLKGQTLGKMVAGIKVVDAEGEVPGILKAILREVVGKFISTIALLLGFLWVAWDPRKLGWHDHIAGTYVVRKR
ncbi:MAG: RDD family protein [Dehalococcoidia bacterium]